MPAGRTHDVVDAANTYAVFVWPRAREDRVRRAQADVRARVAGRSIAGAGMAGLVAAAARAPARRRVPLVPRRATAPAARCSCRVESSGGTGAGRTSEPTARTVTSARSGDRRTARRALEWLESATGCAQSLGTTREPAHDRPALRPGAALTAALARNGERDPVCIAPCPGHHTGHARGAARSRDRGLPRCARARAGPAVRGNAWSEGDGLDLAPAGRGGTAGVTSTSSTGGRCPPRSRSTRPITSRFHSCTGGSRGRHEEALRQELFPKATRRGQRHTSRRRSRAGLAGTAGSAAMRTSSTTRPHPTVADCSRGEGYGDVVRRTGRPVTRARAATVTHTLGGIRVDARARVLRERRPPIKGSSRPGWTSAAIASGGYASGLAAALVFGPSPPRNALTGSKRAGCGPRRERRLTRARRSRPAALVVQLDGSTRPAAAPPSHREHVAGRRPDEQAGSHGAGSLRAESTTHLEAERPGRRATAVRSR